MATAIHPSNVRGIPAPIRDDRALGPTEDLDRQPDGVPHDVVGLTFFFSVLLALLCGGIFMSAVSWATLRVRSSRSSRSR